MSSLCPICSTKATVKLSDAKICQYCYSKGMPFLKEYRHAYKLKVEEIREAIVLYDENKIKYEKFNPTVKVGYLVYFDETNKLWLKPKYPKVYDYADILEYELLEDGDTVTKGGLGRAIVGGALIGGVGAIVGGVTGKRTNKKVVSILSIKITTKDMNKPVVYIDLISKRTKSNSLAYHNAYVNAQKILSILAILTTGEDSKKQQKNESLSLTDEILKLRDLLDKDIITEEEFIKGKEKILS